METLIRLMEMNINALGSNVREDQVWESMLDVRAIISESRARKGVGLFTHLSSLSNVWFFGRARRSRGGLMESRLRRRCRGEPPPPHQ